MVKRSYRILRLLIRTRLLLEITLLYVTTVLKVLENLASELFEDTYDECWDNQSSWAKLRD